MYFESETPAEYLRQYLPNLAASTIQLVMENAELYGGHAPGSWTKEGIEHHLAHAVDHIASHQAGDRTESHLHHALCRIAMALWSYENGILGNNGPEGVNLK